MKPPPIDVELPPIEFGQAVLPPEIFDTSLTLEEIGCIAYFSSLGNGNIFASESRTKSKELLVLAESLRNRGVILITNNCGVDKVTINLTSVQPK